MNEILFRGKRMDTGEWVSSGNLITFNDEGDGKLFFIPKQNEKCSCTHDMWDNIISFNKGSFYKIIPFTVGQFTGLTDKKGVRIFEGDICRVSRPCVLAYGHITFRNGCFWFVDDGPGGLLRLCDVKTNGFEIEVIGNIHDNPGLVEVNWYVN